MNVIIRKKIKDKIERERERERVIERKIYLLSIISQSYGSFGLTFNGIHRLRHSLIKLCRGISVGFKLRM